MVTLNLTLFIELGLFLVFLWVTNAFIIRPVLRTMDERENRLDEDGAAERQNTAEASDMEHRYRRAVAACQRAIHESVERRRRAAIEKQLETLAEYRRDRDQEIEAVHRAASEEVDRERNRYPELVPELVQSMVAKLGLGDGVR